MNKKIVKASVIAMALFSSSFSFAESGAYWSEPVEPLAVSPWAYQGTNVFGTLARIPAADRANPLEKGQYPTELDKLTFLATDKKEHNINDWLNKTHTDSFLVYHNGKLVIEEYFNGMRKDTPHRIHSITKTVLGMVAGQVVSEGLLDPEKLVTDYLPQLEGSAFKKTKVRHLLDMTSGLDWSEDFSHSDSEYVHYYCAFGREVVKGCDTKSGVNDYMSSLRNRDVFAQDGEIYNYRSVLSALLGMVIESATDDSFLDRMAAIWQNIGAEDTAFQEIGPKGTVQTSGGIYSSARDLTRFGVMMLNNGNVDGNQVIPKSWMTDTLMVSDKVKQAYDKSKYATVFKDFHYRNQTWVKNGDKGEFYGIGIYGQLLYVNQSADVVIVKLSSQPERENMNMYIDSMTAFDKITQALNR